MVNYIYIFCSCIHAWGSFGRLIIHHINIYAKVIGRYGIMHYICINKLTKTEKLLKWISKQFTL